MKKKLLFKNNFYVMLLLFLVVTQVSVSQTRTTPGVAQTFYISSPAALTATYSANLIPGDIVILADNTYSSSATMKFNGVGTAENPITLRPATPGGVTFTGGQTMDIGGDWCIIEGFRWKGGVGTSNFIEFRDGTNYANNSILQNCVIDGVTVSGGVNPLNGTSVKHNWVVLYGTKNTVINCSFLNKITSGNMILAEYQFNASPLGDDATNTRCTEVGHQILNNYFYNYSKIDASATNSGDSEAIRIGTSEYQNVQSNALVQNNYFVATDGENEIITNKSKGNSYINNTFRRCRGSLVLRHGSNTVVNGNYFLGENVEGTGGIRIVDSNQTIRNNYIQDCVTTVDNAIWNNGITFLGGNDTSAVDCNSLSMTNGYQKVQNIDVSNNSIVNTNAPLFFNINTGTTKPLGTVSNNLIYFADANPNKTAVITGNTTSPIAMGTGLTYSGNEFKGTTVGETTYTGFTENTAITATLNSDGETYSFSGVAGKGADMGTYSPAIDAMVGNGIGACFLVLNSSSADGYDIVTTGDCNIEIPESLIVGSLSSLTDVAGSYNVEVTANVSWTAVSNDAWISIDITSGTGDATVSVTVTENTGTESRIGTVTFTQDAGGDNIVRTLTITQDAPPPADPRDDLDLINDGSENDNVIVYSVFHEEITTTKNNIAENSLDKDTSTQWSGDNAATTIADGTNVGEIIYDLGGSYDLQLVDYMSTNGKTYEFKILVSSTTADDAAFSNPFDDTNLVCSTVSSEFKSFILPSAALNTKYVKVIGYGQPSKPSTWNTIVEIEFYGLKKTTDGDDDNDGVSNSNDSCPDTPSGESVDENGCSNSQLDDDNDGVNNNIDQCENSTPGLSVNELGCFQLPANNFKVEIVSETCSGKNNGKIILTAAESLNYSATINGTEYTFNSTLEVSNLSPKTYAFCISVDNENFEQCFNVTIDEGTTVAGKATLISNKVDIDITQGTAPFNVYLNGIELFETMNNSFSVDVTYGDLVQVKTNVECEGVFSKQIDFIEDLAAYPNPTSGRLTIDLPIVEKEITIELYTIYAQLISSKTYTLNSGKVEMNLSDFPTGIYLAKVMVNKPITIKVVKK